MKSVAWPEPWVVGELAAGVEDGLVIGDKDVDAVYVAAAGGDAVGQLGHDAYRVGALEEVDAEEVPGGDGGGERASGEGEHGVGRRGAGSWWWRRGWRQFQPIGADILILVRLLGWWSRVESCVGG